MTATRKQSKKSAFNPSATPDSRKRARSPEPQPSSNPAPLSASLRDLSNLTVPELLATCTARKITVSDSAFRDYLLCLLALDKESREEENSGASTRNINNPPPPVRVNNPAVGASKLAALVNRSAAILNNYANASIPEKNFAAFIGFCLALSRDLNPCDLWHGKVAKGFSRTSKNLANFLPILHQFSSSFFLSHFDSISLSLHVLV
jgi:hypothetical protein